MTWTPIPSPDPAVVAATAETQRLAGLGEAPGQCPDCQSYRLDGKAPYVHKPGCSLAEPARESIDRFFRDGNPEPLPHQEASET